MPRPAPPDRRARRGSDRPTARRAWLAVGLVMGAILLAFPVSGAAAAEGAELVVSKATGIDPAGETITVTGSGYDPTGNIGTRPPFAGQPAGVYVVFGRFAETWRPSAGAPSSARQIIKQVWALPKSAHDVLDPDGTNPEIALMNPDGTFTVEIQVRPTDGTGAYAIATYAGSGAVNPDEEVLIPIAFSDGSTTTTTAPTSTTTTPTTTTTTASPTTTTTTTTTPGAGPSGTRSGEGANGQSVTVTPADDLDRSGATVRVKGEAFDPALGIYVGLCVDQGPTAAPSPCVGGVDMGGSGSTSAWVSSNPPPYAAGLTEPFGPGGSFDVEITVPAADEFMDCFDADTRCVIATRADHTHTSDRSADVRVPVYFKGQTPPAGEPSDPRPSIEVSTTTVRAGEPITVSGAGFTPGEQVQVWLFSDPVLVGVVVADAHGAARHSFTVPADLSPGTHHVELRGLTSGVTVRSSAITVLEASAGPGASGGSGGIPAGANTGGAGAGRLAFTGAPSTPIALGALLLVAGVAVLMLNRRQATSRQTIEGENR